MSHMYVVIFHDKVSVFATVFFFLFFFFGLWNINFSEDVDALFIPPAYDISMNLGHNKSQHGVLSQHH